MQAYTEAEKRGDFSESNRLFGRIVDWLDEEKCRWLPHDEVERRLQDQGRELMRQLYQDHLDLREQREPRLRVVKGSDGESRSRSEGSSRELCTVFGEVTTGRLAYRKEGCGNLHPSDCVLNLPKNKYSHELCRLGALEAARGSFDGAVQAVQRATGVLVGKRQLEEMAREAAQDFDLFYRKNPTLTDASYVLALSCDGKGIVMLNEYLREPTRKAADSSRHKLKTRLSKGEKRNRKRMATVGAVYDSEPVSRAVQDIISAPGNDESDKPKRRPVTRNKWLMASVEKDTAQVVSDIFDEAERRDPLHRRQWVVLVDGACHQLECIKSEASRRGIELCVIVDFVHVFEYLWKAAWCFFDSGDAEAERWVYGHAASILQGNSSVVAGAIRRKATCVGLRTSERKCADDCADYLINKGRYLDYPLALRSGWPISTGVIEGACRHLVKDRMDITGARWSLQGAEAVLRLRALIANDDFDAYWRFHVGQELKRNHLNRFADGQCPLYGE